MQGIREIYRNAKNRENLSPEQEKVHQFFNRYINHDRPYFHTQRYGKYGFPLFVLVALMCAYLLENHMACASDLWCVCTSSVRGRMYYHINGAPEPTLSEETSIRGQSSLVRYKAMQTGYIDADIGKFIRYDYMPDIAFRNITEVTEQRALEFNILPDYVPDEPPEKSMSEVIQSLAANTSAALRDMILGQSESGRHKRDVGELLEEGAEALEAVAGEALTEAGEAISEEASSVEPPQEDDSSAAEEATTSRKKRSVGEHIENGVAAISSAAGDAAALALSTAGEAVEKTAAAAEIAAEALITIAPDAVDPLFHKIDDAAEITQAVVNAGQEVLSEQMGTANLSDSKPAQVSGRKKRSLGRHRRNVALDTVATGLAPAQAQVAPVVAGAVQAAATAAAKPPATPVATPSAAVAPMAASAAVAPLVAPAVPFVAANAPIPPNPSLPTQVQSNSNPAITQPVIAPAAAGAVAPVEQGVQANTVAAASAAAPVAQVPAKGGAPVKIDVDTGATLPT